MVVSLRSLVGRGGPIGIAIVVSGHAIAIVVSVVTRAGKGRATVCHENEVGRYASIQVRLRGAGPPMALRVIMVLAR